MRADEKAEELFQQIRPWFGVSQYFRTRATFLPRLKYLLAQVAEHDLAFNVEPLESDGIWTVTLTWPKTGTVVGRGETEEIAFYDAIVLSKKPEK